MIARHGNVLARFTAAALAVAVLAGCASTGSLWPFGSSRDEAFRQQVEKDPFPKANQVGLQQKDAR